MSADKITFANNSQAFFKAAGDGLLHIKDFNQESLDLIQNKLRTFFVGSIKEEKSPSLFKKLFALTA